MEGAMAQLSTALSHDDECTDEVVDLTGPDAEPAPTQPAAKRPRAGEVLAAMQGTRRGAGEEEEDTVATERAQELARVFEEARERTLRQDQEELRRQERKRSKRRRARQLASVKKASLKQALLDREASLRRADREAAAAMARGEAPESAAAGAGDSMQLSKAERERFEVDSDESAAAGEEPGPPTPRPRCSEDAEELEVRRRALEVMSLQQEFYRGEMERLRFAWQRTEEELESWRLQGEARTKELAVLRVEREMNRKELERLRLEGEKNRKELKELRDERQDCREELEAKTKELAMLRFVREMNGVELENLRLDGEKNRKELKELREEQKDRREELEALQSEAERSRKELERLQMQRQSPPSEAPIGLAWEFQANGGVWTPYTSDAGDAITQSYMRGDKTCTVVHGGCQYEISLQEDPMVQTNCTTGRSRGVRCTLAVPAHWSTAGVAIGGAAAREQLRQWGAGVGTEGCRRHLTVETVLKPIIESCKLEEFSDLLRDSVFHHHRWEDPASECDRVKRRFAVCEAYHVENILLYQGYRNQCRHLQNKHVQTGVKPKTIQPDVTWPLWNLGEQLGIVDTTLNERLLFHGTSFDTAKQIAIEGFDSRLAKERGMYGQGTYFAAQSCKSHQYTKTGEPLHTMLLARVALGDPYYTWRCDRTIRRPPKRDSHEGSPLCDSLIAVPGWMEGHKQGWQSHMEFVIFEQMQAYPEYILRYRLA